MKTVVMTGGTSGIGEIAARKIAASPDVRLLVGARSGGAGSGDAGSGTVLHLALAVLESVRRFAAEVLDAVRPGGIDVLVLNAGLAFQSAGERTADGYETTFAVNHLAHQLLVRLLLDHLSPRATVVVTTSGAHDPAEKSPIPTPHHADAHLLAHPDLDTRIDTKPSDAGGRAYTASKLCNMLTVRAAATQPIAVERSINAIAYDPGPTPGAGLSRSYGPALKAAWWLLGTSAGRVVPRLNSRRVAGEALADLALGAIAAPPGAYYARLRKGTVVWSEPSALARDNAVRDALWHHSITLAPSTT